MVQYNNNVRMMEAQTARLNITKPEANKSKSVASTSSAKSDIPEDILEKYRTKQPNHSGASITSDASRMSGPEPFDQDINDEVNIHCEAFMFENAKKKLRFVLSNAEIQQLPCASNNLHNLVCFLFALYFFSLCNGLNIRWGKSKFHGGKTDSLSPSVLGGK